MLILYVVKINTAQWKWLLAPEHFDQDMDEQINIDMPMNGDEEVLTSKPKKTSQNPDNLG